MDSLAGWALMAGFCRVMAADPRSWWPERVMFSAAYVLALAAVVRLVLARP